MYIVNTSQYQLVYALTSDVCHCLNIIIFNGSYQVILLSFQSFLTEIGEIVLTTTQCGGKVLFMKDFHTRVHTPTSIT